MNNLPARGMCEDKKVWALIMGGHCWQIIGHFPDVATAWEFSQRYVFDFPKAQVGKIRSGYVLFQPWTGE